MKLLVLIEPYFQDIELTSVLGVLITSQKLEKWDYYSPKIKEASGQYNITHLTNIKNTYDVNDYDAIYIPGGVGAQYLRKDEVALDVVRDFQKHNKYVFTICDAPNSLREANVISQDCPYSSYPSEFGLAAASQKRNNDDVTVSGKLITGRNSLASMDLGYAILATVYSKDVANLTYQQMSGRFDKKIY
ncbi:DJ-1/PfpI family protein [Mycoplasma struthionis]|uniref:DJ-1 family protein n=1 Tax=Mycoplasma struthionis TaxID=538220 RepID=A0A3G8LG46_9MOLU|nr:DJ-1/PfpI family protein [Mycoplasma struthionis]AZG68629.1 DJ-1 family protein [Mycoplasma struthionis]TPI02285.1 DJ-1 family protein [Mycoplasma struthionis]